MALCETPSRIWRRIQDEQEPSSLPSLPEFEHSLAPETVSDQTSSADDNNEIQPVHSTPVAVTATAKLQSSTSSTLRFASSIASRSASAKLSASRTYTRNPQESFDISAITSLPGRSYEDNAGSDEAHLSKSTNSVPEAYLPPMETDEGEDMSLVDALESVSRASSPLPPDFPIEAPTPKKGLKYDYSISLRSEPKPSPFDKYRNVALRKPITRTRTPSLSRTTPSPVSSPPDSTPKSNRSLHLSRNTPSPTPEVHIPLPRSASASPAVAPLPSFVIPPQEETTPSSVEEQEPSSDRYGHHETSEPENAFEEDEAGHEQREPTFSTSSDMGHPADTITEIAQSTIMQPSYTSSFPAFTTTPMIAPRPRARFNVHQLPGDQDTEEEQETDSGPVTPRTRRRSFLLSVINSTARPRMKAPTPHPRRFSTLPISEVSSDDNQDTPVAPLRKAFLGVTPRPGRGRLSHPLAQVLVPEAAESASETGDGNYNSPYDSAGERMSIISTASSHDLTTHMRANTSYDPAIGLGERGKTGRFDAQKLNTYLHVLNRRLQDENIALAEKLRKYEDVKPGPRLSIAGSGWERRASAASGLGGVNEESGAEGWAEEKLELETMVQKMEEDIDALTEEKAQLLKNLDDERHERARDKERWRERMEKEVSNLITALERKAEEAEARRAEAVEEISKVDRDAERARERLESERDLAMERAAQAEIALESGKELGGALREANSKVSTLTSELQVATVRIEELEDTLDSSRRQIDDLKHDLKEEQLSYKLAQDDFHGQLSEMATEVMCATARISELDKMATERGLEGQQLVEELQLKERELSQLQKHIAETETANEIQKEQLSDALERIAQFEADQGQENEHMEVLEREAERHSELARHLEEALEAAEEKMRTDEEALSELRAKLTILEREQERQQALGSRSLNNETEEVLEAELDEANKEIARLNTLLQQSPARKAVEKAKDARIEMLERERDDLLDRVKTLRASAAEMATPSKVVNMSGISPIHRHVLSMSMKAPKTPGKPLRDLTWLNNTTADPNSSPLLAEIARLQSELDRANESIDQKLDQLEGAGFDVIGLSKNLEDARQQLVVSEKEVVRLQRREARRLRRLEKIRCQNCQSKFTSKQLQKIYDADESSMDISHSGLLSPPTKTSETLRLDLENVNAELSMMKKEWRAEKRRLLNDKAILEDAANRMKIEAHNAKEETKRVVEAERVSQKRKADNQEEAERAKAIISDLEAELRAERMQLRQMSTEHDCLQREILDVARQLQRTESDMEDVKRELQKAKQENHEVENELRANSNMEQKARHLEAKVLENNETIGQLRQERSILARDHKELQRRFTEVSERANKVRADYAASQNSHEGRRQQLDTCLVEIDELRRALANQTDELQRTEQEKNQMVVEKTDIARTIEILETELKRVKKDAEIFGRDLKILKAEKAKMHQKQQEEVANADRTKKQSQAQIRLLSEQLENQRAKTKKAREEFQRHVCSANGQQLEALKAQHKQECKGLIVQIRYLKAKFTRESTLRDDLTYQKQYLLVLLSNFEESEKRILVCIARIGYPKQPSMPVVKRKSRSLKSAALCVIFIHRAKCASDTWRETCANKQAIADALQEVRRRRVTNSNR